MTTSVMLAFLATSAILAVTPGPDNLFVMSQAAMHGRKSGIVVTLGLCTGLIVHSIAVALGIAVIFQTSATAFTALKIFGGVYLLYLAWKAFKSSEHRMKDEMKPSATTKTLYIRGIVMNITNPKVSIFFLAFLPQFTDPSRGSVSLQVLALGALFIVATFIIFGTISTLSGLLHEIFKKSERAQKFINRIAGFVFVGLAAKLVTAKQ
ncbi:LysE family translocator [Pelagicoccus sp. SDUM812003]|uniref:LysE family translocator n=1 Tax=Pelagicoccus sp. SDUM812003 TaxID=3041267 RepID=UPI00280C57AE|nr:LysE family translocator [Pelagicoccus sp. SDUM812003]MDQ8201831.1 LysE family translocator [Pelagicoccus sp. SDUM812003]